MKYLCLVYLDENRLGEVGDSECKGCVDGLRESGHHIAAEALASVHTATTVRIRNGKLSVTDGPFAETKELVAGFWLWQVRSMEEAVEWLKRSPFDGGAEVEIRPVFEAEDFGAEFTPELREQEERLRMKTEQLTKVAKK